MLSLLCFGQVASDASALTPQQQKVFQEGIYYFDVDSCASTPATAASPTNSDGTLNITNIVNKYKLQSVIIQRLGDNSPLASYNANQPPVTPASTMKLIIADVALQSGLDLDKTVSVESDVYYDGSSGAMGNSTTLRNALIQMLSQSDNVAANVLMKAMGGVDSFTQKAHSYSYNNTNVKGYYDPSNDGKNSSTIQDEVNAMAHIFSLNKGDYQTAQDALKQAAQSDDHYNVAGVVANKWAGTSQVAGNVGMYNIGGSQYIVGLYYNGSVDTSSGNTIQSASADLAGAISSTSATNTTGSAASSTDPSCCPPSGTGSDVTSLTGKDSIEQTINFFLQEGLSLAQAAGIAANLAWETGGGTAIDPLVGGPDPYHSTEPDTPQGRPWGIAQWTPYTHYTDDKKALNVTGSDADLLTQLQVVLGQLQGKGTVYGTDLLTDYEKINDPADAANYIRAKFEVCDTSNASCSVDRPNTAVQFYNQYNGSSLASGSGTFVGGSSESDACGGLSAGEQGTVAAAVAAAKLLSSYKIGYVWGGLHSPGQLDITDGSKLQQLGADCSGSVSWVLHQAGMFPGSAGIVSGDFGSWGQAGKGQQMTVWENADHVFIEFNVPGLGHYELNTAYSQANGFTAGQPNPNTPGSTGPGPQFFKWGSDTWDTTSGFTPRHWPGT